MVPRGFGYVAKLLKDDRLVRLVQKGDVTLVDHRFALRSTE
jgi:hypothetical protein